MDARDSSTAAASTAAAFLIAYCTDVISKRRYAMWYEPPTPPPRRRFRGGAKQRPFVIVQACARGHAATARTLREALAWHDRNVISPGWSRVLRTNEEWEQIGLPAADRPLLARLPPWHGDPAA